MAVQMIALKPHRYAGKALQPGDEFFVGGNTQARLLTALGRASLCPPLAQPPAAEDAKPRRRKKAEEEEVQAPAQTTLLEAPASPAPEEAEKPAESPDDTAPQ